HTVATNAKPGTECAQFARTCGAQQKDLCLLVRCQQVALVASRREDRKRGGTGFDGHVAVDAAKPAAGNARAHGPRSVCYAALDHRIQTARFRAENRMRLFAFGGWRNDALIDRQHSLDEATDPGGSFGVADNRFERCDTERAWPD